MEPIIKFENVFKTFPRNDKKTTEALSDISFTVMEGECFGILGESGSGKSTIARILAGLITPTSGSIQVAGHMYSGRANGIPKELIGQLQMVFQNPLESFNPRRKIGVGIGESLANKGVNKAIIKEKVDKELEVCGLPREVASRYPHQLSGGQGQRAAIARALITEPKIIICDEATSALDVTVQKQIIELLFQLKKERNITIIFISHNIPLVEMICDRAMILKNGRQKGIFQATSTNLIEYF